MVTVIEKLRQAHREIQTPYNETFMEFCQALSATDLWTLEQKNFMAGLFYQYNQNKRRGK